MFEEGSGSSGTESRPETVPHTVELQIPPVTYYVIDVNLPKDRYHVGQLSVWEKRGYPWKFYKGLTFEDWQKKVDAVRPAARKEREQFRIDELHKKQEEEAKKQREKQAEEAKKKPASKAKPPTKKEMQEAVEKANEEKKKAKDEQEAVEKAIRENIERTDGDQISQRATSVALQAVAGAPAYEPNREEILRGISSPTGNSKADAARQLLAPKSCRALSTSGEPSTPAVDYKLPTWEISGAPSVTQPGPKAPFGRAHVILMSRKDQESVYLSLPPRIRIHAGRGKEEPAADQFSWEGNTGGGYHVIKDEDDALNGLWWTEGCVRVSKQILKLLLDLLHPLKKRLEVDKVRDFVGFVIVREDLAECFAKDYCTYKAVAPRLETGLNFQKDKRTIPKGSEKGTH
jgi:hypothetical protein